MGNKKVNKNKKGIFANYAKKTKDMALNANQVALTKTEEFVSTSIEITEQWQGVADKAVKGGLKLAAKQQELVFDILNEIKGDFKEGQKRFKKLVA
ncbi:hypothetical protein [Croceivirga thetidis]|uniref:Phasin family protein n=1 Tax=Croceivirga thetidis TaxID=2721623 RepID=A0ABX1GNL0_9FLAO|nr:hypothetical protein [Croceivirga thetidis]NKI31507.1 hypothetical protein [Croceivirga thetidis]